MRSITLVLSFAATMLVGCGALPFALRQAQGDNAQGRLSQDDTQPRISAPGAMPRSLAIGTRAERGGSWMLAKAKSGDLIYVTGGCAGTCVVTYPGGEVVGSLDVSGYLNAGVCSDNQGNVYISNNTETVEYAHGGSTPIATLELPANNAAGCSVDPATGNLAVMFADGVAIFAPGSQTPKVYAPYVGGFACAYDPSGNLFVGGLTSHAGAALAELPKGASGFVPLTIESSKPVQGAGQVQWYDGYLSYGSGFVKEPLIYRLKISGTEAIVVKTTRLNNDAVLWYPWIYQGKIIAPSARGRHVNADTLGIWKYPRGGKPAREITGFGSVGLESVTVSVAASH